MEIVPQIFNAKVMHKRLFPKVNGFTYNVYYLALPLSKLNEDELKKNLPIDKFGILSFYEKDYGNHSSGIESWIREILTEHGLDKLTHEIILITMPRVLGYVFNPVSFWLCLDKDTNLRAVLCEVNNTFGESHNYLCYHKNHEIINSDDWLDAEKLFHVSPFLKREGSYKFRFSLKESKLGIWIDFYDGENNKQLITTLIGELEPLTKKSLRTAFFKHPLITLKTIFLIHWQALKLISKGIKYIPKPPQIKKKISTTSIE